MKRKGGEGLEGENSENVRSHQTSQLKSQDLFARVSGLGRWWQPTFRRFKTLWMIVAEQLRGK